MTTIAMTKDVLERRLAELIVKRRRAEARLEELRHEGDQVSQELVAVAVDIEVLTEQLAVAVAAEGKPSAPVVVATKNSVMEHDQPFGKRTSSYRRSNDS